MKKSKKYSTAKINKLKGENARKDIQIFQYKNALKKQSIYHIN